MIAVKNVSLILFRNLWAWQSARLGLTAILDGQYGKNVVDHVTLLQID
ncbi:MAG: hypothetical protein R3C14_36365 [Caldilineaceae bacterium]